MASSEEIDPFEEPKLPEDASPDKIAIFEAIRTFYHSNEQELALTQFTKPKLRVFIHEIADAYGLYHRSEGKGRDRAVALRKTAPQIPCGQFDQASKNWTPYTYKEEDTAGLTSPSEASFNLRCLTFNVLHDPAPYRATPSSKDASPSSSAASSPEPPKESSTATTIQDETYPELRRVHTFEFLRSRNAHIITLNEVSKEFYANLLQEPWAQAYWIASLGDESLTPGNLILSQFPIKSSFAHQLKFSHKIINIVELVVPSKSGKTLWLATGHLKAGPLAAYGRFRRSQVNEIVQQLHYQTSNPNYIIMGDLNIRTSEKEHIPQLDSWTDVWPTLHPNDEGLTYDPWSNSLAEFASNRICTIDSTRTKVANRYDRIYIKCPRLHPISAEILGNIPLGTFPSGRAMYMSDHWALEAILKLETA